MAEAALLAPWSVAKAVEPDANYRQKRKGVYDNDTSPNYWLAIGY